MKATTEQIQEMTDFLTSKANEKLKKARSCWDKGVIGYYLLDMIEKFDETCKEKEEIPDNGYEVIALCLNGACNWLEYSWGGCSLIYDSDIAETLCTPSELKKNHNGERRPNSKEQWLDVQARALGHASWSLRLAFHGYMKTLEKGKESA